MLNYALNSKNAIRSIIIIGSLSFLLILEIGLAIALIHHLYFNDDLEQIARAAFFSDLYKTQFSVHAPIPAIVSFLWSQVFGASYVSNRALAAGLNGLIIISIFLLTIRFSGRRWAILGGLLAGLIWLTFENDIWAFMNVASLYSAVFLYLGLYISLNRLPDGRLQFRRPMTCGVLWALAFLSRVVVAEQLALIVIVGLILGVDFDRPWRQILMRLAGGFLLTILVVVSYFAFIGKLPDLFYWTIKHNLIVKSGSAFSPMAWIGNLNNEVVADVYIRIIFCWALVASLLLLLFRGAQQLRLRRIIYFVSAIFLGGWLAANPSGIGETFMQAIPAFPAMCIAVGVVASHALSYKGAIVWKLLLVPTLLLAFSWASLSAAQRFAVHVKSKDALPSLIETKERGDLVQRITSDQARVFVFGADPLFYVRAARGSATFASILYHDLKRYEPRIVSEMETTHPAAILFDKSDYWFSSNLQDFPLVASYILDHYRTSDNDAVLVPMNSQYSAQGLPFIKDRYLKLLNAGMHEVGQCGYKFVDTPFFSLDKINFQITFGKDGEWDEIVFKVYSLGRTGSSLINAMIELKSRNNFGDFLDDSRNHLRFLVKDKAGKMSWIWFGKDYIKNNDGALFFREFNMGEPISKLGEISEIQIGGWGLKNSPINVDGVYLSDRGLKKICGKHDGPSLGN